MTRNRNIAAGAAAASLAVVAAGAVVAVVKYRQGHPHTEEDTQALEQLEVRLRAADGTEGDAKRVANIWNKLRDRGGASREVLLDLVGRLKAGKLDDVGTNVLEYHLDEVEGEASQKNV